MLSVTEALLLFIADDWSATEALSFIKRKWSNPDLTKIYTSPTHPPGTFPSYVQAIYDTYGHNEKQINCLYAFNSFMVKSFDWGTGELVGMSQQAKIRGGLIEVIPCYNKGKRQQCCGERRRRCSHLHIKAKVLFLFKEEIKDKFPHKVGVQRVIDHFCPTELEERQIQEQKRGGLSHPHYDHYVSEIIWPKH